MDGLLAIVAAVLAATGAGLLLRHSGRRLATRPATSGEGVSLGAAELGAALGERATLVQFSTAFCQPCRATRQILERVSEQVEGVRHIEIDAESHLDLVRRLDVRRTPTILVLDTDGRVVRRASGQPRPADVVAAVAAAVGP